jgi:hypothetical protein
MRGDSGSAISAKLNRRSDTVTVNRTLFVLFIPYLFKISGAKLLRILRAAGFIITLRMTLFEPKLVF